MANQAMEPRMPNGERYDFVGLCLATNAMLEDVMRMGTQPKMAELSGWEFRGYNTPSFTAVAGFQKFKKGFYREDPSKPHNMGINGYNVKIQQGTLGEPWIDMLKGGESIKFGWYSVYPVRLTEKDNQYPNALLINYGASSKNFPLDPTRMLRDYIVQVYPDNPDLILGKATLAMGLMRVPVSFFILERLNRSSLGV